MPADNLNVIHIYIYIYKIFLRFPRHEGRLRIAFPRHEGRLRIAKGKCEEVAIVMTMILTLTIHIRKIMKEKKKIFPRLFLSHHFRIVCVTRGICIWELFTFFLLNSLYF